MKICEHCGKRVPTAEQRTDIRKLADGLRTVLQIAEAAGVTYNVVYQQLHREGLAARRDDRQQRGWDRYLFAAEQRAAGKSLAEIGAALGVGRERARQMVVAVESIHGTIKPRKETQ